MVSDCEEHRVEASLVVGMVDQRPQEWMKPEPTQQRKVLLRMRNRTVAEGRELAKLEKDRAESVMRFLRGLLKTHDKLLRENPKGTFFGIGLASETLMKECHSLIDKSDSVANEAIEQAEPQPSTPEGDRREKGLTKFVVFNVGKPQFTPIPPSYDYAEDFNVLVVEEPS